MYFCVYYRSCDRNSEKLTLKYEAQTRFDFLLKLKKISVTNWSVKKIPLKHIVERHENSQQNYVRNAVVCRLWREGWGWGLGGSFAQT